MSSLARQSRWAVAALAASATAAAAACLFGAAGGCVGRESRVGELVFTGREPVAARIEGQEFLLSAEASRCTNCHDRSATAQLMRKQTSAEELDAPVLDAASLLASARRRGGPSTRFDAQAFCRLLNTGIDPANIVIERAMPRYQIDATRCLALWHYLIDE